MDESEAALPDALYPLHDGSYGSKKAYEAEHAGSADTWGRGTLLLNPSTKSYLTPFGFKSVFEHHREVILERFGGAGLDPDENYFYDGAPDILIRWTDERFIPASHLPQQQEILPLTKLYREEDVYLQNFNRDGSKHTGSYTPYVKANDVLREHYAEALAGETQHGPVARSEPDNSEPVSPTPTLSAKRIFTRTSRDKRRSARRSGSSARKDGRPSDKP